MHLIGAAVAAPAIGVSLPVAALPSIWAPADPAILRFWANLTNKNSDGGFIVPAQFIDDMLKAGLFDDET